MPRGIRKQKPIAIDRVTFRSSIQIKQFQHVHVEAGAAVPEGADPSAVLHRVKQFVAAELRRAKEGDRPVQQPRPGRFPDMLNSVVDGEPHLG